MSQDIDDALLRSAPLNGWQIEAHGIRANCGQCGDRHYSLNCTFGSDQWRCESCGRGGLVELSESAGVYFSAEASADHDDHIPFGIRPASEITPQVVEFLWPNYVPKAKVTLLIGDPGIGKSTLALKLAAEVSRGGAMPVPDASGMLSSATPQGRVLYLNAEDGAADTVRPRLDQLGADLTNVYIIGDNSEALPSLASDGDQLASFVMARGIALLVIDPLQAFLGGRVDTNKMRDVRPVMQSLARLASETGAAVVCVLHLNKKTDAPTLYRINGSIDLVAAARSALLVDRDSEPDDPNSRTLTQIKSNLARPSLPLGFSVGVSDLAFRQRALPPPVNIPASDNGYSRHDKDPRVAAVQSFLKEQLSTPKLRSAVVAAGRTQEFSESSIERAYRALGGQSKRQSFGGPSLWSLPNPTGHAVAVR